MPTITLWQYLYSFDHVTDHSKSSIIIKILIKHTEIVPGHNNKTPNSKQRMLNNDYLHRFDQIKNYQTVGDGKPWCYVLFNGGCRRNHSNI